MSYGGKLIYTFDQKAAVSLRQEQNFVHHEINLRMRETLEQIAERIW